MLPAPLKSLRTDILTLRERGDLRIGVDLLLLDDELLLLLWTMMDDDSLYKRCDIDVNEKQMWEVG